MGQGRLNEDLRERREVLVDALQADGHVRSVRVAEAFRAGDAHVEKEHSFLVLTWRAHREA